jgi:hypothetical protein
MPLSAAERRVTGWFMDRDMFPVPIMFPVMRVIYTRMDTTEKKEFLEAVRLRYLDLPYFKGLIIPESPDEKEAVLVNSTPAGDRVRHVYVLQEPLDEVPGADSSAGPPLNPAWHSMWTRRKQHRNAEGKKVYVASADREQNQLPMMKELLLVVNDGDTFSAVMRWFRTVDTVPSVRSQARRMIQHVVQLRVLRRPHVVIRSRLDGPLIEGRLVSVGGDLYVTIRKLGTHEERAVQLHPDNPEGDDDLFNILHPAQQRTLAFLKSPRIREIDENVHAITLEMAGLASPRGFVQRRMVSNFSKFNPRYAMLLLNPPAHARQRQ